MKIYLLTKSKDREGGMKVTIEKYYKEIGSLSSCFGNGFKWLYLSFFLLIFTNPTQYKKIAKIDGKNKKKSTIGKLIAQKNLIS